AVFMTTRKTTCYFILGLDYIACPDCKLKEKNATNGLPCGLFQKTFVFARPLVRRFPLCG
uniref:hypothetical protein n=1 Tax=Prevotella sp. TaxID=59823 RepID=UPI00402560B9